MILDIQGVRRTFDRGEEALRGIDLGLEAGEVVGLVGKNGAGKTTLLRIAMGLLLPNAGSVRIFGLSHESDSVAIKQRIGYVSEDQVLPPFLRVSDVLELHRGLFPTWDAALENKLAERFEIPRKQKIGKLSKGQARQVAVLCAVAHRPELLILDEPAGGLDPATRREFLEVAIETLHDGGSTILFSSHHMQDLERIAGRIALLHGGRKLLDGDLDDLRERHTLAVAPMTNGSLSRVRDAAGCLAVREHAGELRAVFEARPDELPGRLAGILSGEEVTCSSMTLEDLFIEAVEGQPR